MIYTSGTTGIPKGVILTHNNILSDVEGIYKIIAQGRNLKGIKKTIFFWSVNLANDYELQGKSLFYKIKLSIANKLVFKKWREALGGNLRMIVSGGAAIQPRLSKIFTAAGIPVLQGYGLTETSPVIAVNTFEKDGQKWGTVGKPLFNVKVKIAEDGEILCKGPNVMKGYYKEPELTRETINEEGWLHTGDIGAIDSGELTASLKLKRVFIQEKYQKQIDTLFNISKKMLL